MMRLFSVPVLRRSYQASLTLLVSIGVASAALESNLVSNSPFLPPDWNKQSKVEPTVELPVAQGPLSRELEFRGIFEMGGVTKFSIFDKSTQKGDWIPLNGSTERFSVIRFNKDKDSIVIRTGSGTEELTLATADDKPMPVIGQAPPTFTPPGSPPNFKPPTAAPTSAPTSSPPKTIPPPPPAALLNARRNSEGSPVQRRRIIRNGNDDSSTGGSGSGNSSNNSGGNGSIPDAPNFTPGGAPDFIPPPPPSN